MRGVSRARERPGENGTAPAVQSTDMGAEPTREGGGGRKARTRARERERGAQGPRERERARGGARPTRERKSGIRAHGAAPEGSV